jgi:hypothetical protein
VYGGEWANVIDSLTMYPDARKVVRMPAESDAAN